ncbi:hypothetical protein [Flavobacterium sp.]|uniref:hypothetical protein n=1 Tax=Flavobacterium sp. TaxID=239 RepID=UPI00261B780F|nr:hypothetical protein [Flavobacterium sp.]
MRFRDFLPVCWSVVISAALLLVHKLVLSTYFKNEESKFTFSIWEMYAFFGTCFAIIMLVSVFVKKYSINSFGQSIMLMTFIEMGLCFALFFPGLENEGSGMSFEKSSFLIVFLLFLAIETILAIRLLNKNQ